MTFRVRKQLRFGPLRVNLTQHGVSRYTVKLGSLAWNSHSRKTTPNTPGPGYMHSSGRDRNRQGDAHQ